MAREMGGEEKQGGTLGESSPSVPIFGDISLNLYSSVPSPKFALKQKFQVLCHCSKCRRFTGVLVNSFTPTREDKHIDSKWNAAKGTVYCEAARFACNQTASVWPPSFLCTSDFLLCAGLPRWQDELFCILLIVLPSLDLVRKGLSCISP